MKKKVLAILLACCLVASMMTTAFAASYTDTAGTGAESAIERWTAAGVVDGNGDGSFNPKGSMTRAQAAAVFTRLLKLTDEGDISAFTDIKSDAWYAPYVAKCVAAGILNGTGKDTMSPSDTLSREQMFVMTCRALGIAPQATTDKVYDDASHVASYAQGYVNALLNLGYINGKTDSTIVPKADISRAEMMLLLDKSISNYVTESGTVEAEGDGVVLIVPGADDVTITGDFSGIVVAANDKTTVDLKGVTGTPTVNVLANDVAITNAPAGTTVTTAEDVTGTTANGSAVSDDSSVVISAATTPSTTTTTPSVTPTPEEPATTTNKFELNVSSNGTTISATVDSDYVAILTMPQNGATVSAKSATIALSLTDVESLGITGTKTFNKTITGVEKDGVDIYSKLSNVYNFDDGATVNATVDGESCTYKIGAFDSTTNTITATPVDVDATRTAWKALTAHVTNTDATAGDSSITLKANSYIQLGTEKLFFGSEFKLDNIDSFDAIKTELTRATNLTTTGLSNNNEIVLAAGSVIVLDGKTVTLNDTTTITITGVDFTSYEILSRVMETTTTEDFISQLVLAVNNAFDAFDGATANVTITFAD
jgi:hypothetical protein